MSWPNGPLEGQQDANRGRTITLCPGDVNQTVLELKSKCTAAVALAVILDVRVAPDNDGKKCLARPQAPKNLVTIVRAHVQSGIGGTKFCFSCDALLGTVLVVPAENLLVTADYLVFDPCGPCDAAGRACLPKITVGAGLAYFGIGRNSNASRFTEVVCVPPQSRVVVQIPQYALSWTAKLAEPATSATIRAFGLGGGYPTRYEVASPLTNAGQNDVENSFPIDGTERFLEVENTSDAPLAVRIVYGLSF